MASLADHFVSARIVGARISALADRELYQHIEFAVAESASTCQAVAFNVRVTGDRHEAAGEQGRKASWKFPDLISCRRFNSAKIGIFRDPVSHQWHNFAARFSADQNFQAQVPYFQSTPRTETIQ